MTSIILATIIVICSAIVVVLKERSESKATIIFRDRGVIVGVTRLTALKTVAAKGYYSPLSVGYPIAVGKEYPNNKQEAGQDAEGNKG